MDTTVSYPGSKTQLGRYCGPDYDIGPAMNAKILKANVKYAYRLNLRRMYNQGKADPVHSRLRKEFDRSVTNKLGKKAKLDDFMDQEDMETPHHDLYDNEHEGGVDPIPDRDDLGDHNFDNDHDAQVLLPVVEDQQTAKVKRRKLDKNGNRIGRSYSNPILYTRVYDVEFPEVTEKSFAANIIAQNIYSQCDANGNQYLLMDAITDHKRDQAEIKKTNAIVVVNGQPQKKKTTKGWFFCILWRDGTTTWEGLSEIK